MKQQLQPFDDATSSIEALLLSCEEDLMALPPMNANAMNNKTTATLKNTQWEKDILCKYRKYIYAIFQS